MAAGLPEHSRARVLRRWPVLAAAIVCAALISGELASSASAFHIPGATYNGRVAGGGTISFNVSGDGASVQDLTLNGPIQTSPSCTLSGKQYGPTPITDNTFNNGEVSGGFANVQGATGYFSIVVFGLPDSCRVTGTWSAATNADPAPSEECKQAQAAVKKRKGALRKAKIRGTPNQIKTARGRWVFARAKRDKVC